MFYLSEASYHVYKSKWKMLGHLLPLRPVDALLHIHLFKHFHFLKVKLPVFWIISIWFKILSVVNSANSCFTYAQCLCPQGSLVLFTGLRKACETTMEFLWLLFWVASAYQSQGLFTLSLWISEQLSKTDFSFFLYFTGS